jgi:hypothetical protein
MTWPEAVVEIVKEVCVLIFLSGLLGSVLWIFYQACKGYTKDD